MAGACLLFPGIAGNEINWEGAFFRSQSGNVWINTVRIALGGLQWLALDPSGTDRASRWYPYTRPGGAVPWYYPPLTDYLSKRDWKYADVYIDWRKTIAANAPIAAQAIRDASAYGPVTLVCHSRGGMVAAAACQLLAASGELNLVRRGVSLGTPWRGSYAAIGYLGGYDPLPLTLSILGTLSGVVATPLLLGLSVQAVLASWPGLYELLPDPAAAAANGDPNVPDVYNAFLWGRAGVTVSAAHLAAAQARWASNPGLPTGLSWTHIVGTGFRSKGPLLAVGLPGTPQKHQNLVDGDGTVPTWSATALGGTVLTVNETHTAMVQSGIVHGLLESVFQGP